MTFDAVILKALEGGKAVTVSDIVWRVEPYVRHRLEKLRYAASYAEKEGAARIGSSLSKC